MGEHVYYHLCSRDPNTALESIRDACGGKSPATALKRARDLGGYISWAKLSNLKWWPLNEHHVMKYITWTTEQGRSKLVGRDLLSALRFFKFIMGCTFYMEQLLFPVLTGRVRRPGSSKAPRRQARPLTVQELLKLENLVVNGEDPMDRDYAGCLFFVVLSRSRWSDISQLDRLDFDFREVSGRAVGIRGMLHADLENGDHGREKGAIDASGCARAGRW